MDRTELARSWAAALYQVAYVSRSRDDIERDLGELISGLLLCLRAEADLTTAVDVGERLVTDGFVKPVCLRVSIDVLGPALPELCEVDTPTARSIIPVMAALAAGFAAATRDRLFSDQEDIRQALARTKENVERDLEASEARFREVFTTSAIGIVISDFGGGVARANEAVEDMLGYPRGTLFRKRLDDLFDPAEATYLRRCYNDLAEGGIEHLRERTTFIRADGEIAWVRVSVSVLRASDGRADHHVTMVEDITDFYLLEHQMRDHATRDVLTGLPNRRTFLTRLEEALAADTEMSVFHLGLDGIAAVNNGIGRNVGDRLLREVANRLIEMAEGHNAIVARVGGDEFAILMPHTAQCPDVATLATRINDALAEPTYVDDRGLASSATIAVMRLPAKDTKPAELLCATEITLRSLKAHGRGQWGLVDIDETARRREHYSLAAALPGAWESGE
ncbi:MAG: diguanylate cyclase, partial [Actinomycetota bacterium]|nr:diguanylate cyclase [Actinomycetota bacterium]